MSKPDDKKPTKALDDAKALAGRFIQLIAPYCERILIVGSVRRKCPEVHDIDVVAIPKRESRIKVMWFDRTTEDVDLLHGQINDLIHGGKILPRVKKDGKTMVGHGVAFVEFEGFPVDIYYATEETWTGLILIRTGSARFNTFLASRALRQGKRLHADGFGVWDAEDLNRLDDGRSEVSIFKALGLDFRKPEDRDIPFTE